MAFLSKYKILFFQFYSVLGKCKTPTINMGLMYRVHRFTIFSHDIQKRYDGASNSRCCCCLSISKQKLLCFFLQVISMAVMWFKKNVISAYHSIVLFYVGLWCQRFIHYTISDISFHNLDSNYSGDPITLFISRSLFIIIRHSDK